VIDLSARGAVRVGGADRVRFLQGMITADVVKLAAGDGCYAFQLDQKGHVLADMHVLCGDDAFLLECDRAQAPLIVDRLAQYAIADRVDLLDISAAIAVLAVEGPASEPPEIAPWAHREADGVTRLNCSWTGQPGYRLITAAGNLQALRATFDLKTASAEAVETVRIENGQPRLGQDFGERNFPQETGLLHAVAFDKGCYRGQETVERIRSRGQVNRLLVGLRVDGDPPAVGAAIEFEGATRPIGEVTSVVVSPALGTLALGYVRRERSGAGTALSIGGSRAVVADLPFRE